MTLAPHDLHKVESPLWFCLKSQPKHEHIAAASLRRSAGIECFAPRIRYRKNTRRGALWFTEAMFPGYLFARFVYVDMYRQVRAAHGITNIVHFGEHVAILPESAVAAMRETSGEEEIIVFEPELSTGDVVTVTEGPFQGLAAVVTQLLPAKERVKVLIEFLGRSVEAEVSIPKVLPNVSARVASQGAQERMPLSQGNL